MIKRWLPIAAIVLLCAAGGCASTTSALNLHLDGKDFNLHQFLKDHPVPPGEAKRTDLLASGPTASIHIVQIRGAETPHVHAEHDLRVVVVRGRGTMVIRGKRISAGVGSVFEIRRGVPHFFVSGGSTPAAALATFSPPYDGKDMVPAPAD